MLMQRCSCSCESVQGATRRRDPPPAAVLGVQLERQSALPAALMAALRQRAASAAASSSMGRARRAPGCLRHRLCSGLWHGARRRLSLTRCSRLHAQGAMEETAASATLTAAQVGAAAASATLKAISAVVAAVAAGMIRAALVVVALQEEG